LFIGARRQMGLLDLVRGVAVHPVWEVASNALDTLSNLGVEFEKCDRWGRFARTRDTPRDATLQCDPTVPRL